jgi:hypothetical protein
MPRCGADSSLLSLRINVPPACDAGQNDDGDCGSQCAGGEACRYVKTATGWNCQYWLHGGDSGFNVVFLSVE